MFPTPPDSPDGPSDTEGEKEGGRRKASRRIERGSEKVKRGVGSERKERRGSFGVKGKSWEETLKERAWRNGGLLLKAS